VFNLQGSEIIVILILALVVLGPEKLPNAIRQFTKTYTELRKMSSGFQSELKSALDEPMREMRETANLVRDAADPNKIVEEAEAEQRLEHTRVMEEASPITTPVESTPWDSVPSTPAVPGLPPPSPSPSPSPPISSPPAVAASAPAPPSPPPPSPPPASANPDRSARPNPVGPNPDEGPAT
jgi:sec-independent protein translocase protein TatB